MMVVTGILLFFLLANGYLFLVNTVHILPRFSDKKRAVEIGRALQVEVSRYLFTSTAINIGLGFATAAVMVALCLPDPLLWGGMATLLRFNPYAGTFLAACPMLLSPLANYQNKLDEFSPPPPSDVSNAQVVDGRI